MHVYDGFAALKFFEDRLQNRVPEVHAVGVRKKNKAIEPEGIECVGNLVKGSVDIRQRKAGETSKSVRACANEFCRELVAVAC